jgi:flagellar biosynthesis protein FlhB
LTFLPQIVASIYGTGLVFSFEGLKPSFGKLNPVKKIKSLFSKKTIYDLFITIIFTIVEGYMVYSILKMHIDDYIYSLYCGIGCFSALFFSLFVLLLF